eukprot:scaffold528_cov165-Amphora_coffeaeformis.AAC.40
MFDSSRHCHIPEVEEHAETCLGRPKKVVGIQFSPPFSLLRRQRPHPSLSLRTTTHRQRTHTHNNNMM